MVLHIYIYVCVCVCVYVEYVFIHTYICVFTCAHTHRSTQYHAHRTLANLRPKNQPHNTQQKDEDDNDNDDSTTHTHTQTEEARTEQREQREKRRERKKYKIPYGGLFELIGCPHYFAEMCVYFGLVVVRNFHMVQWSVFIKVYAFISCAFFTISCEFYVFIWYVLFSICVIIIIIHLFLFLLIPTH